MITGATSGFGKATAELLATHGHKLILVARRTELLDDLKKRLETPIYTATLDIRNKKDVATFFQNLPKEFQDIDILVNNAGLAAGRDLAFEANIKDWETMIDTNIKGLLYCTREILNIMKRRNNGLIINIGSVAGYAPYAGGNVYGATKAFVKHFSNNLLNDLIGTNIKVTNIEPGMAETEFSIVRFKGDTKKAKAVYENTRSLSSEDIAQTIFWVIHQPDHVNIDSVAIMPVDQAWGGVNTHRKVN